jgi:hypothetical protein
VSIQEITVPLNDTKLSSTAPQAGASEPSSIFPIVVRKQSYATLPEPSPLRKSTRHVVRPQPATTTPVTSSTGAGGVRSSWLRRDTHLPDKGLTGTTAKNTMVNAGPSNFGLSVDGPLAGSKRKSDGLQDGTEVGEARSAKIARRGSREKDRDVDAAGAHARVAAQVAHQESAQERPASVPQPEPVAQAQPPTEQPPLNIFDDETQLIPHDDDEDTNERLQRLAKMVKAALPESHDLSGGIVQMEIDKKPGSQRPSKEEQRGDSGRLSVSHLVGTFEKTDRNPSYTSTTPPHSPPKPTAPAVKFAPPQPVAAATSAPIKRPIFQPPLPKSTATSASSRPVPQAQPPTVAPAPSQPGTNTVIFCQDLSRPPPVCIFDAPPLRLGGIRPAAWPPIAQPLSQATQSTELESIFDVASQGTSQTTTAQMSQSSGCEDEALEEECVTFPGWGAIKPDEERDGETMAWVKNIPGGETEGYIDEGDGASDEGNAQASSQESEVRLFLSGFRQSTLHAGHQVSGSAAKPVKGGNTTSATTGGGILASMASMASKATNQLKSIRLAAVAAEKVCFLWSR